VPKHLRLHEQSTVTFDIYNRVRRQHTDIDSTVPIRRDVHVMSPLSAQMDIVVDMTEAGLSEEKDTFTAFVDNCQARCTGDRGNCNSGDDRRESGEHDGRCGKDIERELTTVPYNARPISLSYADKAFVTGAIESHQVQKRGDANSKLCP
jgi:hypothetical protein